MASPNLTSFVVDRIGWPPVRTVLWILIGVLLGSVFVGVLSYMSQAWNDAVVATDVEAKSSVYTGPSGGLVLQLTYTGHRSNRCPSNTQNWLERTDDKGIPHRWPIGPTANGFARAEDASGYYVYFELPPDAPDP